jgi:hypothetical protein
MLDYDSLKATARSIGRPVKDLLALAPNNDPFYAGVGFRRCAAEWFAEIWKQHGELGSHLRRLHYRLVSTTSLCKPDGRPYNNTEGDWNFLIAASGAARYLDLVPFDGLVDRRNDEPMIFAENMETDPDQEIQVGCQVADGEPLIEEVKPPEQPELPWLYLDVAAPVQKYIVEVWIEKSTQNDWLVPLCQRRGVNLVIGIGEQSEIRSRELALRSAKYGAPVRIIYISDFDPGGRSMPKAVARKVEFTIAKFDLDVDLQLIPLALTPDQCREYRLPRTPIKDTERRKDKFEQIFGAGATELDAIEALHPGELGRLLEAELDNWLDPSLDVRFNNLQSDLRLRLRTIEEGIHDHHADEIQTLKAEFATIADEFASVTSMFDDWEERASQLWQTIAEEIDEQSPDLSDVEVPRSQAPGETDRFVLFDSRRDYFTQMDAYNAWRDGDENGEAGAA